MNMQKDKDSLTKTEEVKHSRRNILKGAGLVLMGGIAGKLGSAVAAKDPADHPAMAPAPPLPWKWVELDPMEAGTRAYQSYLKKHGG